jgi:hypothetical protein
MLRAIHRLCAVVIMSLVAGCAGGVEDEAPVVEDEAAEMSTDLQPQYYYSTCIQRCDKAYYACVPSCNGNQSCIDGCVDTWELACRCHQCGYCP